jgi:hypothetical protein
MRAHTSSTEWTEHFEVAVEVADGSSAQGVELRNWTDSSAVSTIRSTKVHRCHRRRPRVSKR